MDVVYNLIMMDQTLSSGGHQEEFNIGFFSSYEKAEKIARKYREEVAGFHDYDCAYHIETKPVIGDMGDRVRKSVYIIYGWNENQDGDEIDVVESDCFASKTLAERELGLIKAKFHRENWCMDRYQIDECHWKTGFTRME